MNELRNKLISAVETCWEQRAHNQDLVPGTQEFLKKQGEFFAGAMVATQALDPDVDATRLSSLIPPDWVVKVMSGRPIGDHTRMEIPVEAKGRYAVAITKVAVATYEAASRDEALELAEADDDDGNFADWNDMTGDYEVIEFQA